jgi:hypothetical protein
MKKDMQLRKSLSPLAIAVVAHTPLAVAAEASHASSPLVCPVAAADVRHVDLRGKWTLAITPDSAKSLPNARVGHALPGTLELTRRDSAPNFVVYSGRYSAKLQSVGLARDTGEVLVSVPPGDTARIVIDPSVDHGNLELVGKCRDDRLSGRWVRTGAPARAWGHFTLRRVSS